MNTNNPVELSTIVLRYGTHDSREDGMCAMEAVAFLANEPHSDHPACACPVVSSAVRRLNDRIVSDKLRTELLVQLLPKLLNSRSASTEVMRRRAYVAADWAVRVFAPIELRARGREEDAAKLEAARPICDKETAEAGRKLAYAAAAADAAAYAAYAADAAAAAGGRRRVYVKCIEMIEAMLAVKE